MMAVVHAGFFILLVGALLLPAVVYYSLLASLTLERAFPVNQIVELGELRARDRARHGRILQISGGVIDFPVYGSYNPSVGLYFTKVKLGSPPKEFNVQIDTGSDILWVACSPCDTCPKSSGLNTLELIQQERVNISSKLKEKRSYYTKVMEETIAKLEEKEWINSNNLNTKVGELGLVMELELKKLYDTVASIHEEMFNLCERKEEMQELNRVTNSRMAWLSFLSLVVCPSVAGFTREVEVSGGDRRSSLPYIRQAGEYHFKDNVYTYLISNR